MRFLGTENGGGGAKMATNTMTKWSVCTYCNHKPGAGHIAWRKKVDDWKEKRRNKRQRDTQGDSDKKTPPEPANDDAANAKKLALSQSLQAALTTTCGISPTEWNDVWASCCSETGN